MPESFLDLIRQNNLFSQTPVINPRRKRDAIDSALGVESLRNRIQHGTNPFMQMGRNKPQHFAPEERFTNQTAPNVVYNAGPEMAEKKMKEENRRFDTETELARERMNVDRERIGATNAYKNAQLGLSSERNEIARMKAQNPRLVFKEVPGGNIVAFDPTTAQVFDTGVASGRSSDEDKQAAIRENLEYTQGQANNRSAATNKAAFDRLAAGIAAQNNRAVYGQESQNWRQRLRDTENPPLGPVERKPSLAPTVLTSPDTVIGSGNSSGDGFRAAPGQFEAKPGQYDAAVGGKNPVTGQDKATEAKITPEIQAQAKKMLEDAGKPVTEKNIATVAAAIVQQQETESGRAAQTSPSDNPKIPKSGPGTTNPIRRIGASAYSNVPSGK